MFSKAIVCRGRNFCWVYTRLLGDCRYVPAAEADEEEEEVVGEDEDNGELCDCTAAATAADEDDNACIG